MSSVIFHQYAPVTVSSVTVPVSEWEDYVEKEPEIHGVKWIHKNKYAPRVNEHRVKRAKITNPWTALYYRYRASACNKRESQNAKAVSRPIQKHSKKIDCTAKMAVSHLFDFDAVSITYKNQHNLVIGSVDDLRFLYLSASVKQQIESCLRKDFGKREVSVVLNRHFAHIASESRAVSDHRDQYVYCHAIYKSELSEELNAPIFKK